MEGAFSNSAWGSQAMGIEYIALRSVARGSASISVKAISLVKPGSLVQT
jgi:hypothetical protein